MAIAVPPWWVQRTTLLCLLLLVGSAAGDTFLLEAEQYVKDRVAYPRTTASGIWAVHFYQNEVFPIEFCVQSSTTIQVTNVRYSNDGGQDYVDVKLDGEQLGTFLSLPKSSGADEWNQFEDSGEIGQPVAVLAGRHHLDLAFVSTDRYGIEIDFVALHIADQDQDERLLQCTSYCDDSINHTPTLFTDSLPSAWLRQRSRRTTCAEEQNVQIEVYHPGLQSYRLTAQHPVYSTRLDTRQQDFHSCLDTDRGQAVWFFNNFHVDASAEQMTYKNSAALSFSGSNMARNTRLTVRFSPSHLTSDALLSLKIRRTPSEAGLVHVLLLLNGTDPNVAEERSTDPSQSTGEVSWTLDSDMLTGEHVELELVVVHRPSVTLHVDYLRLEVAPPREVSSEVYRDTMTLVQAVTGGSSGSSSSLSAGAMVLYRPDNRDSWHNVEAIAVLKKLSWSEGFEEIFRLDRRGMLWLKPRSDYASESPPYGTTVVVGPSDPGSPVPKAPISRVDVDPWALKFTITYADSSVSDVVVRSGSFGSRAIVTHGQWAPAARAWPVAVVTSMWVADGKADVDHVSANGAQPRGVLSGWERLFGTSFAFFRQCISRHNTQAPDISLELLEPRPDIHMDLSGCGSS
ncbi:uncharacterized protein LOC143292056 [Babylonia areolata]|uniref:uncharacterized protein LOC143292056 n=1 Tax=Babylonia areolata TaxID=304850 RepID=UPI003FD5F484